MPRLEVTIKTRDGICPASVFTPADKIGPWPAVIFFMDGLGIRPVLVGSATEDCRDSTPKCRRLHSRDPLCRCHCIG